MKESIKKKIKDFYFSDLKNTFDKKTHNFLEVYFEKYLWETTKIINIVSSQQIKNPKILDAGGGIGVPSIILSKLFKYECTIIDRYDEFDETLDREMGSTQEIYDRLEKYNVKIVRESFINNTNNKLLNNFNVVTSFSVIEHLSISPKITISSLSSFLLEGGTMFLTTPNQAHIFNRIKLLFGKNVWEDLNSFTDDKIFYGHIREYLLNELRSLIKSDRSLLFIDSGGTNYSINSFINRRLKNIPTKKIIIFLLNIFTISKYLKLQIYISAKKI